MPKFGARWRQKGWRCASGAARRGAPNSWSAIKAWTVDALGTALNAEDWGDGTFTVTGLAEPRLAGETDLAIAGDPKFAAALSEGAARAALLWQDADPSSYGLNAAILVGRPRFALSQLTGAFDVSMRLTPGIDESAVIHPSAVLGDGVEIGPFVFIGAGAEIGAQTKIGPQVTIGANSKIGSNAVLGARVSVGQNVAVGQNFIAQPGAVIGGDGFSFVTPEPSDVEAVRYSLVLERGAGPQVWSRIYSLGGVQIGNNVEMGANSCVDQGTLRPTVIGNGTKIDNLVQVGHNAIIAGSSVLGNRVVLGGQAGVVDHVVLGDDLIVGASSMVRTNQKGGRALLGDPAIDMKASIESYKGLRRLPRLFRDVAALKTSLQKD